MKTPIRVSELWSAERWRARINVVDHQKDEMHISRSGEQSLYSELFSDFSKHDSDVLDMELFWS
jgi:hypothetical protein